MKVSAGLDSLFWGKVKYLAVKKMMRLGQENQSTGPILNRLLSQSVSAERKLDLKLIWNGSVSISSAAVELAQLKIGQDNGVDGLVSLNQKKFLSLELAMSRLLITHLKSKGCDKLTP